MNEKEIPYKISELKKNRKEAQDEELEKYDRHYEILKGLQDEFGFNLDVATEIYENRLLDPIESEKLLEQWTKLFTEVQENPGNPLVVVMAVSVSTGVFSIAHSPHLKYSQIDAEVAIVQDVTLDSFVYVPENEETGEKAYIAVEGDTIIRRPMHESVSQNGLLPNPAEEGGLIVAQDFDPYSMFAPSARGIGDEGVSVLYNPTWGEAHDLINSRIDDDTIFPVHFLDPLRPKNKAKS